MRWRRPVGRYVSSAMTKRSIGRRRNRAYPQKGHEVNVGMAQVKCGGCGSTLTFAPSERPVECHMCGGKIPRPQRVGTAELKELGQADQVLEKARRARRRKLGGRD